MTFSEWMTSMNTPRVARTPPLAAAPTYSHALPPAINYTPSAQWQEQLARSNEMFNGLLGGTSGLNMTPTRVAPKPGQSSPQNYTAASLSAQYLK